MYGVTYNNQSFIFTSLESVRYFAYSTADRDASISSYLRDMILAARELLSVMGLS